MRKFFSFRLPIMQMIVFFTLVAVASPFNWPITRGPSRVHQGYDYQGPCNVPVPSRVSGTVTMASSRQGYGKVVAVDKGGGCREIYAHLSSIHVGVGQRVGAGTTVGLSGRTGRVRARAGTCILHYEKCSRLYAPAQSRRQQPRRNNGTGRQKQGVNR